MRVALIGLGEIADYHLRAIKESHAFEVMGGCDLNPDLQAKLSEGAKFYKSSSDLLRDDSIETVILLVPGGLAKAKLSGEVVAAGKNLITEKPAVSSPEELLELQTLARENGAFVHGAFHSRFSPTTREIARLLDSGEYSRNDIAKLEVWADSPHIINGEVKGESSEDTSLHGEGPNILSEALLYVMEVDITAAQFVRYSDKLHEVHTQMEGTIPHGKLIGVTSWIRGLRQKGVRLTFSDGRQLVALHTKQELRDGGGRILFDGKISDLETSRMQKEYNTLYRRLDYDIERGIADNTELITEVARLVDTTERLATEISPELRCELFIPRS